ncbi:regulatory protein RecX [Psychromicrobium xiongbiense]|uniref:regulatory protein RecX n=1 Tax=Psychromicrobium xiongbiense TaxID=3051184 RepID=UPI002552542E|nr:regulatory protein RecX [Psychromicrobium sp. YIM S02556]
MTSETPAAPVDPEALARSIVLRQLTASPRSRKQLTDALAKREVPDEVASTVLDRFEELRLIDDAEFAALWVRSRAEHRSLARGVLRRELVEKGISADLIEQALAQRSDNQERASARELVRRKLRTVPHGPWDRAMRDNLMRRLTSMLARRGYPSSLAWSVVSAELEALGAESDVGYS